MFLVASGGGGIGTDDEWSVTPLSRAIWPFSRSGDRPLGVELFSIGLGASFVKGTVELYNVFKCPRENVHIMTLCNLHYIYFVRQLGVCEEVWKGLQLYSYKTLIMYMKGGLYYE